MTDIKFSENAATEVNKTNITYKIEFPTNAATIVTEQRSNANGIKETSLCVIVILAFNIKLYYI